MDLSLTDMKKQNDAIAKRVERHRKGLVDLKDSAGTIDADLESMPNSYKAYVTKVAALAAAHPGNPAIQLIKSELDMHVQTFVQLKTASAAIKAGVADTNPEAAGKL